MPDTTTTTPASPTTPAAATTTSPKGVNFSDTIEEEDPPEPPKTPLYMSSRLKGYITLILASIINYSAARNSDDGIKHHNSDSQRAYAESVALVSCLICCGCFLAHIDRCTPLQGLWESAFRDGSMGELVLILFLVIWWTTATGIITTVRGIAGDGRQQYNLYYSTWGCCWTSYWTLERWLVAFGWSSFKAFISSWPFRAPGWIAIMMLSFFTLMWYLDLYSNHEEATADSPRLSQHYADVGDGQWEWLLFVGVATLVPSVVFIVIELFRETSVSTEASSDDNQESMGGFSIAAAVANAASPARPSLDVRTSRQVIPQRQNPLPDKGDSAGGKGPLENILEGFCLVLLVLAWIPTVIVATTPGGAASLVGNAYFFTWMTTVFVMETFIWFVHDLRKGVHSALQVKEREYQKFQTEVLQKSRALEAKRMAAGSWQNDAVDDIELDEIPATARMNITLPVIVSKPLQPPGSMSSQEDDVVESAKRKNNEPAFESAMSKDVTEKRNNVRGRLRGPVDLDDDIDFEEDIVPMPPQTPPRDRDTPRGSTVFFEAASDMDEPLDNVGEEIKEMEMKIIP